MNARFVYKYSSPWLQKVNKYEIQWFLESGQGSSYLHAVYVTKQDGRLSTKTN